MGAWADFAQHLDDVADVIVKIEGPIAHGHHAGIDPIGDIDISRGQQGLDGAAQQCGIVAGHRRNQQHLRLRGRLGIGFFFEMNEIAKGPRPDDLF